MSVSLPPSSNKPPATQDAPMSNPAMLDQSSFRICEFTAGEESGGARRNVEEES